MRGSFVIYTDSLSVLEDLEIEQAGALFMAIASYQRGDQAELNRILEDKIVRIAFRPFLDYFIRDANKYDAICEKRREYGKLGGMKRAEKEKDKSQKRAYVAKATICKQVQASASKSKQVQANQADNENENESTNVDNKERYTDVYPKKGELSLPCLTSEFERFNAWLKSHCPYVLRVRTQMCEADYHRLKSKGYTKKEICDALESLNNWKDFPKKRTNVYRSTLDELKRKYGEKKQYNAGSR